jgi:hypothetical protein
MSWAAPTTERPEDTAAVQAMLRRRKSSAKLYWRLKRPTPRVYARALVRVIVYRVIAAVVASLAVALCVFLGVVAGNISYPRWPHLSTIQGRTIILADVHAVGGLGRWVPIFVAFGLILVCIPRAHRFIFGLTLLSSAALGYYQRYLPPLPASSVTSYTTRRTASLASRIPFKTSISLTASLVLLAAVAVVAYILYRRAYSLTKRTTGFIPRRPVNHYHSAFISVSLTRRLAAAAVTWGLLSIELWIIENIRAPLPDTYYGISISGHSVSSAIAWILAAVVVALIICMPCPQGFRWLFYAILVATFAYAFSPHAHLVQLPTWLPAAHNSFWALVIAYIFVTGLGFYLVAALLDWTDRHSL